jgi:hypothetical protein
MNKKEYSFVENECILAIKSLADKHPNDSSLGAEIRKFLNEIRIVDKKI